VDLILGKHAQQMVKPALSAESMTTSPESASRQAPLNRNSHGELPHGKLRAGVEATEHFVAGHNRNAPVNKTFICCR